MSSSGLILVPSATAVDALGDFDEMDAVSVVAAARLLAEHARMTATLQARAAAKIGRLCDPSLGISGLARTRGFANAESFLEAETGTTKAEATKLIRVGELLGADSATWQGVVGGALAAGDVSVEGANTIRLGLGGAVASEEELTSATRKLVVDAGSVGAAELSRRIRTAREELDADSIARNEKARHDLRYFHAKQRDDGMVTGSFAVSGEDGVLVMAVMHQATSPKNIGPRFVDSSDPTVSDAALVAGPPLPADPRTRGQKASDVFTGLLRIGAETDANAILGLNRPSVVVHVAAETIAARAGHGIIEDCNDFPIAFSTVERHLCSSGVIGVGFDDDGQSLNVGRDQRLFTKKQRIALAARDGGCRFPDCDRPISWTEAHHVEYWQRDTGTTNIADGILLCRSHHQVIHDNKWQIRRGTGQQGGHYWLTPPPGIYPDQTPREMPSKQPLIRALQRA